MTTVDIAIVGAGPAGIAAAIAARKSGASVAVIDDNQSPGGQIWRNSLPKKWQLAFSRSGVTFLPGTRVIDANAAEKQLILESTETFTIAYSKLILATGARELFVPFPGWTLPHVFGVGGLQALVKSGLSVDGKRIIVAGSGPLLLAVASYLAQHGARVPVIAEQASWKSLAAFGAALLRHPSKIRQAIEIKRCIPGSRYLANTWVTSALGRNQVEQVVLSSASRQLTERCDYLAVAYGFAPNTELPQLLGCKLNGSFVQVDRYQQTTVPDVYCAGEPTGLGGVDESLLEGEVAGCAATHRFPALNRASTTHFSRALNQAFALRSELRSALTPETIVCRCEDVPYGRLVQAKGWREAKLHYRCGMGPCQGRVCGPAVEYLLEWTPASVRPPIFPTSLQNLITVKQPGSEPG